MKPEEIGWWAITPGWWKLRSRVLGGLAHEQFRTMLRETYPAQLPPEGSGWWERYGKDVIVVRPDPEVVAHAHHLLERARRAGTVAVGPADRDELYAAQVDEKARRRAHLGRGVCSGWADEDDYGPRYS